MKKLFLATCFMLVVNVSTSQTTTILPEQTISNEQLIYISQLTRQPIDYNLVQREFIQLLNEYRKQNNLLEVSYDSNVQIATDFHVNYMSSYNILTHENPIANCTQYKDRIYELTNITHKITASGECCLQVDAFFLNYIYKSYANGILESWKQSPGHNKILINPAVTRVGISVYRLDSYSKIYACLILIN